MQNPRDFLNSAPMRLYLYKQPFLAVVHCMPRESSFGRQWHVGVEPTGMTGMTYH